MSRNNRWYVLGREVPSTSTEIGPIEPGEVYMFYGWSRTKEASIAKRAKLDRAGRHGIHVFSPSRAQAAKDAMACYGVKVAGYISDEDKRAGRMIVKAAVQRAIFCPFTGKVLDMRRTLVFVTPTSTFLCSAEHWDSLEQDSRDYLLARPGLDAYDGRELFKR